MAKSHVKVVLDTNVLVSAVMFGGKPRQVVNLVSTKEIKGVTSQALCTELEEVLLKKFSFIDRDLELVKNRLKKEFEWVSPLSTINVARDRDDNRVLEAAATGNCSFIITGDPDLLDLKKYRKIKIMTPSEFLALNPPG